MFRAGVVPRRKDGRRLKPQVTAAYLDWKSGMRGVALYREHIPAWQSYNRYRRMPEQKALMDDQEPTETGGTDRSMTTFFGQTGATNPGKGPFRDEGTRCYGRSLNIPHTLSRPGTVPFAALHASRTRARRSPVS